MVRRLGHERVAFSHIRHLVPEGVEIDLRLQVVHQAPRRRRDGPEQAVRESPKLLHRDTALVPRQDLVVLAPSDTEDGSIRPC